MQRLQHRYPPMIVVLKKKISFDKILGPSVFTFLSVCPCVCLSVGTLFGTVWITQTCRSIFRQHLCTASCHRKKFWEEKILSKNQSKCFFYVNLIQDE